ncbi:pentapeptide repeat-containing protein [Rhodovulum sulfidophilum]|uniref:pentapeptide repeat-containing protein n=1 Tax=Rhodovulum sulfidophilum TaxID=35806 RepID=UPI0022781F81|nr:pentapeptide repeat-containing protein [Rhodovulum sulfidophilum]
MRPSSRPPAALSLALAVALGAATLPAAHAAGPRDRAEPLAEAQHRAWRAIGRVNVAGFDTGGFCTGTLIAPDRVLTAAHCLYALRGGARAQPGQVHFLAGWYKGSYAAHRTARAVRANPDFHPGKKPDSRSLRSDVAILLLETPITGIAPLALALPERIGPEVTVIGYRRDRPNALSRVRDRDHVNVMEILCAYICENSHRPPSSQPLSRSEETGAAKASLSELTDLTDVQTALTVLGRRAESRRHLETAAHYRLSLSRCNLAKCDLSDADFSHAAFAGSNLNGAFLYRSRFRDCNFTSASMKRVQGYESIFEGAVFENANLSQATFNRSCFLFSPETQIGANFSQAQMEDSVVAFSGVRGSDRWALGANFAEATWKNAIIIGFESQRDTDFGFRTARTGADTPPRPATIHQGLAFRDCILGAHHIGTLDLERCFGDGTVVLIGPIIRPPHWPSEALSPAAFDRECARWRADPASYVPPQDRA